MYTYDSNGNLTSKVCEDFQGRVCECVLYDYDSNGKLIHSNGHMVHIWYEYNEKGDCIYRYHTEYSSKSRTVETFYEYHYHENGGKTEIRW